MAYNVALRYNKLAGGYAGVITWTSFKNKTHFDKWFARVKDREIVEEGITQERAVALARTTSFASRVAAALEEATDKQTGEISDDILLMKIRMILLTPRMFLSHQSDRKQPEGQTVPLCAMAGSPAETEQTNRIPKRESFCF